MLNHNTKIVKYYEPSAMDSFYHPVILKCGFVMEQQELNVILNNFKEDYVLQTASLGYFRKVRKDGNSSYVLTSFHGKILQECPSLYLSDWLMPGSMREKKEAA